MQTRQNAEKNVKCGDFLSVARGNAKLMIIFFGLIQHAIVATILPYLYNQICEGIY